MANESQTKGPKTALMNQPGGLTVDVTTSTPATSAAGLVTRNVPDPNSLPTMDAADGTIGATAPTIAIQVAGQDSNGKLQAATPSTPLPVAAPTSSTASSPAQTSVSGSSGQILAANSSRKECIVVNTGTTVIYLGLGQTPSSTAYHIALAACTASNDGTGGTWVSDMWKGAINAISATSGTVCVTELT